jgi:hypothetical protein
MHLNEGIVNNEQPPQFGHLCHDTSDSFSVTISPVRPPEVPFLKVVNKVQLMVNLEPLGLSLSIGSRL